MSSIERQRDEKKPGRCEPLSALVAGLAFCQKVLDRSVGEDGQAKEERLLERT